MGAVFAMTRFSLVRISIRDLVGDGKSLVRNSGVGGGGENLILINADGRGRFRSSNSERKTRSFCRISWNAADGGFKTRHGGSSEDI